MQTRQIPYFSAVFMPAQNFNPRSLHHTPQTQLWEQTLSESVVQGEKKDKKEQERASAMALARHLFNDPKEEILHTPEGRPYLKTNTGYRISISHSYTRLLFMWHKGQNEIGADIEKVRAKITRLSSKFMSVRELQECIDFSPSLLTIYWSAKESLYKAIGNKCFPFAEKIYIRPFGIAEKEGMLRAEITDQGEKEIFNLNYFIDEGYVITFTNPKK